MAWICHLVSEEQPIDRSQFPAIQLIQPRLLRDPAFGSAAFREIDPEEEEGIFPDESEAPARKPVESGIPASLNEKQANRIVLAMGTDWGSLAQDKTEYASYEDMLDEISAVDGMDWRSVASGLDLTR